MKLTINLRHDEPTYVRVGLTDEEMIYLDGVLPDDEGPYLKVTLEDGELCIRKVSKPKGARKGDIRKSSLTASKTHPWLVIFNLSMFPALDVQRFYLGPNEGGTKEAPDLPTERISVEGGHALMTRVDQAAQAA
jgi:hypothetical protein